MKLSRYTKIYPWPEDASARVLFGSKRGAAVLVPSGLIEDIEKAGLSHDEEETLSGLGLLVGNEEDEKQEMLDFVRELNARNEAMKFTLILNLDCNLACRYCFEGRRKGTFYLSDETAEEFISFVKGRNYSNKEEIRITFYGGEPLLSLERIVSLSEKIRAFAEHKGLQYIFTLITNGALLTPKNVKRLAPLGLESAKVTIDGPKQVHDAFRPFRSGAGSFDLIVQNVRSVCDLIDVSIGGNYTRQNYREFPRLLDYLTDNGFTHKNISLVKFDPILQDTSEFALHDFQEGCSSYREPWFAEAALHLREEVMKRGFRTAKVTPSPCVIENYDSIVVHYDGTFYKCPGFLGRKDCCVGDLKRGLADYRGSHGLDNWKNKECLDCCYLPLCFGGCRYMTMMHGGRMGDIDCRKEYFDKTLESLVMQDIKYDNI